MPNGKVQVGCSNSYDEVVQDSKSFALLYLVSHVLGHDYFLRSTIGFSQFLHYLQYMYILISLRGLDPYSLYAFLTFSPVKQTY